MNCDAMDSGVNGDGVAASTLCTRVDPSQPVATKPLPATKVSSEYHCIRTAQRTCVTFGQRAQLVDGRPGDGLTADACPSGCDTATREGRTQEPTARIPRPPNAFMIFAQEFRRPTAMKHPEDNNKRISTRLGLMWRSLSDADKEDYHRKAKVVLAEHKRKYPNYVYNPREARQRREDERRAKLMANQLRKPAAKVPTRVLPKPASPRKEPQDTPFDAESSHQNLSAETMWPQEAASRQQENGTNQEFIVRPSSSARHVQELSSTTKRARTCSPPLRPVNNASGASHGDSRPGSTMPFTLPPGYVSPRLEATFSPAGNGNAATERGMVQIGAVRPVLLSSGLAPSASGYPMRLYKPSTSWPIQQTVARQQPSYRLMGATHHQPRRLSVTDGGMYDQNASSTFQMRECPFKEEPVNFTGDPGQQDHAQHRASAMTAHPGLVPPRILPKASAGASFSSMLCPARPIIHPIWPPEHRGYPCFSQPTIRYSICSECCSVSMPLTVYPHNTFVRGNDVYSNVTRGSPVADRETQQSNGIRRVVSPARHTQSQDLSAEPAIRCQTAQPSPDTKYGIDTEETEPDKVSVRSRDPGELNEETDADEKTIAATSTSDSMPLKKSIIKRELNSNSPTDTKVGTPQIC